MIIYMCKDCNEETLGYKDTLHCKECGSSNISMLRTFGFTEDDIDTYVCRDCGSIFEAIFVDIDIGNHCCVNCSSKNIGNISEIEW